MANTSIKILRSGVSGRVPEFLDHGVLALNYSDGKLFYKNASNVISYIKNSDSFATINANGSMILATSSSDILNITSSNIDITANNKTIELNVQVTDSINSSNNLVASANAVYTVNQNLLSHSEDFELHNKIITIDTANGSIIFDTFSKQKYRTAEYLIQARQNNIIHVSKVIVTHDDSELYYVEPYELLSQFTRLYDFDATFNGNAVEVHLVSEANTTFNISRTIIPA